MTAIIIGLLFMVVGAWGLLHWFQDFLAFFRGMLPFSLLAGGLVAFIAGIASLRTRRVDDKDD